MFSSYRKKSLAASFLLNTNILLQLALRVFPFLRRLLTIARENADQNGVNNFSPTMNSAISMKFIMPVCISLRAFLNDLRIGVTDIVTCGSFFVDRFRVVSFIEGQICLVTVNSRLWCLSVMYMYRIVHV